MTKKEPIKVLMVAPTWPIVGGQTIQAARLLRAFDAEPEVEVHLQPINPPFLRPLQRLKYVRTVVTTLKYVSDLLWKVPHYDVVHIFSASYLSFVLAPTPALLISKMFRKKTILNYRSGEAQDHLNRWRSAVPTIKLFSVIVAPSDYLVHVFRDFGLPAVSIFNFVESDKFPFRKRCRLMPVFLSNRNFESHYNVACTLKAFRIIQDSMPDSSLIVAGDGPERKHLESLARDLRLDNVKFVGTVVPEDMARLYDSADIYLNSPNLDNMPNSIIEAFACGLPVISTNAGGIPYIVEDERTGLLVDVNDHVGLARAALRLYEDDGLAQLLIANARNEVKKYSWAKVRDAWVRTYRELAQGKELSS